MPNAPQRLLCRYVYDALDRLVSVQLAGQPGLSCFYGRQRRLTEVAGDRQRSLVQHNGQLLAQQHQAGQGEAKLLCVDRQQSLLGTAAYQPFGFQAAVPQAEGLPGFNGEPRETVIGHYLLGNGYRAYSPLLMRFNRPDSWSPFGKGGLNAYGYCLGDPVNHRDPTGHMGLLKSLDDLLKLLRPTRRGSRAIAQSVTPTPKGRVSGSKWGRRLRTLLQGKRKPPAYSLLDDTQFKHPEPPGAYPFNVSNIGPPAYTMAPTMRDPAETARLALRHEELEPLVISRRGEIAELVDGDWHVSPKLEERLWEAERELSDVRSALGIVPGYYDNPLYLEPPETFGLSDVTRAYRK